MASCLITKKIDKVCETQVAGLKVVAVANWSEAHTITKNNSGIVTGITLANIDNKSQKFYEVKGDSNASYFNCNIQQGGNSDSKAFLHQVGFIINRLSADIIAEYKYWVLGKIMVAVQDKNGEVYLLGASNGLTATNFDYQSGAGATDASGITALFEGTEPDAMLKVNNWSVISSKM